MSKIDELDNGLPLRPVMGKRLRARDRVASGTLGISLLVRHGHGRRGPGRARRVQVPLAAPGFAPKRSARRVVIKAHVQHLSRYGAQAAARHLRYIERDGVEKDGSPGVLYGPDGPIARQAFEEPRLGERHQFRFIISPEDGHDLDLAAYTRSLMRRVERDLGTRIEWAAVNHYDTDHPHAHVVVRGVDLDGAQLFMQPAYISRGMRWSAQELATDWLGPRLESEIQQAYEREVAQERLTSLDRELARLAQDRRLYAKAFEERGRSPTPEMLVRRLEQLGHLGLAERVSDAAWELADGWQDELRELGFRGDRLKQIHRALHGGDPARFHVVGPGQGIPDGRGGIVEGTLVGRLTRRGLADESKGTYYAVIETAAGAVYHVTLPGRAVDALEPGALVTFSAKQREPAIRSIDRHLAGIAGERGGVYELSQDTRPMGDPQVARTRLRQLERLGLATLGRSDRWHLAPNLLEQLEIRLREIPRYQLSIEPMGLSLDQQVVRRGPVWLDQVDPNTLQGHGFGADVLAAARCRCELLRELGIAPEDTDRMAKLRDLERRTVGEQVARRVGEAFLEQTPDRFRGRVVGPLRDGASYFAVSNGRSFVLLEATPEARALTGRDVELQCAPGGRVVLRDETACRELGETLARATHCTFLPEIPDRFRGTVREAPSGAPYLVVSDGARFVLVPESADGRALVGKHIEVVGNRDGVFLGLRPDDRHHGFSR